MLIKKGSFYYPSQKTKEYFELGDEKIYQEASKDPILFWENLAKELFWFKLWRTPFLHNPPYFQWFVGGKTNITANIFEKNVLGWENIKEKIALFWEPESPGENGKKFTFEELFNLVNKLSNALSSLGLKRGDRVAIFLPPIPELVVSVLACARIGAVYSIFSPFLPEEDLKERLNLIEAEFLITADAARYLGEEIELKKTADSILRFTSVQKVVVVKRLGKRVDWIGERDVWFEEILRGQKKFFPPTEVEAEEPLFILTTTHPSGKITPILHNVGGILVQTYWTGKWLFNLKPGEVIWTNGDLNWILSHLFSIYCPLLLGAASLIYEGDPLWPINSRWLEILLKYNIKAFCTFPVMINRFKRFSSAILEGYKLENLKIIASFGEALSQENWNWLFEKLGKRDALVLDLFAQAESGGVLFTSLPGIGPFLPGFVGKGLPGVKWEVVSEEGKICKQGEEGNLVVLPPFSPAFFRGCFKQSDDYISYWKKYGSKIYFTGDRALKGEQNLVKIIKREDEIIKVSGYRITPSQLERVINFYPEMRESAVIALDDELLGKVFFAFLVYKGEVKKENVERVLRERIKKTWGKLFAIKKFYFVEELPKYYSGKIAKDVLAKILKREKVENLEKLSNPEIVEKIELLLFE